MNGIAVALLSGGLDNQQIDRDRSGGTSKEGHGSGRKKPVFGCLRRVPWEKSYR